MSENLPEQRSDTEEISRLPERCTNTSCSCSCHSPSKERKFSVEQEKKFADTLHYLGQIEFLGRERADYHAEQFRWDIDENARNMTARQYENSEEIKEWTKELREIQQAAFRR